MSFQAKRLRVQLPNGEAVAFEDLGVAPGDVELAADEKIIKAVCIDDLVGGITLSWYVGSCLDFFTQAILVKTASISTLDAEKLPVLRRQLEAQLKEIDDATQALNEASSNA